MSLSSATRVISPTLGGFLYHDYGGYTNLMTLNGVMMLVATLWAVYVSYLRRDESDVVRETDTTNTPSLIEQISTTDIISEPPTNRRSTNRSPATLSPHNSIYEES
jgi:hypothetical protein